MTAGAPAQSRGYAEVLILGALLVSCVVVPRQVLEVAADGHFGIAPPGVGISTFSFVVWASVVALLVLSIVERRAVALPFWQLAFAAFAALGLAALWPLDGEREGGAAQLVTGVAAWAVGRWLAPRIASDSRTATRVALMLASLMGLQLAVSIAQLAGLPINPMSDRLMALMGDRVNGTLSHPDTLGKVVFVVWQAALLMIPVVDARGRKLLWAAILLGMGPLVLCQGRATLIASLALLVFWAIGSRGAVKAWVRVAMPLAVLALLAPFGSVFLERMSEDPDGGPRKQLTATALTMIDRAPLTGVGPNAYVKVVSAYDSVVAQGYPVHNSFLLTTAELGIPGSVLFWVPWLLLAVTAVAQLFSASPPIHNAAVTYLAGLPGTLLLLLSGWGLLAFSTLPFWFLVLGMFHGFLGPRYSRLTTAWRLTATST